MQMPTKVAMTLFLICLSLKSVGQTEIIWDKNYTLKLSDFQSSQTEIKSGLNSYSISSGANLIFSTHMSNYEFMFTKNFNSSVKAIFNKEAAVIIAPDTMMALQLVEFGQYSFDLVELYSRKFRQQLYEQKKIFSNINFYQPILNKLQAEMNAENARVLKATDLGRNEAVLKFEHMKVMEQIRFLSGFCLECKPVKDE